MSHVRHAQRAASRDPVRSALREILVLNDHRSDRRAEGRCSYFGPVSVELPHTPGTRLSAFARDISASGIGLVHLMPLSEREVIVHVPLPSGRAAAFRTRILWCRDYHDGWYATGGKFLDTAS